MPLDFLNTNVKLHNRVNKTEYKCEGCGKWKPHGAFRKGNGKCTDCNKHEYPEDCYQPEKEKSSKRRNRSWRY